jgi:predicted nucleic acid-binding Zn ribbon protein
MTHLAAPKADVVEQVFSDWQRLVGEVIAAHTRPKKIANGVLFIEVDDPAWASEMRWMSEELLERISTMLETVEITEISVQLSR